MRGFFVHFLHLMEVEVFQIRSRISKRNFRLSINSTSNIYNHKQVWSSWLRCDLARQLHHLRLRFLFLRLNFGRCLVCGVALVAVSSASTASVWTTLVWTTLVSTTSTSVSLGCGSGGKVGAGIPAIPGIPPNEAWWPSLSAGVEEESHTTQGSPAHGWKYHATHHARPKHHPLHHIPAHRFTPHRAHAQVTPANCACTCSSLSSSVGGGRMPKNGFTPGTCRRALRVSYLWSTKIPKRIHSCRRIWMSSATCTHPVQQARLENREGVVRNPVHQHSLRTRQYTEHHPPMCANAVLVFGPMR